MSLELGDLIDGKYRLIRLIGEGGWGSVYEGENTRTLRRVAIKVLRPQFSASPDMITRFEREAQAAGRIGSEHIVEVFDLGSLPDGTHFMVMELLVGEDLATRLARLGGSMDPVEAVGLIHQLLLGLGAAHEAGIVHRDLKPENLFVVPMKSGEEFLKILDFGISKFNKGPLSTTKTGAVLGTPYYMAPEQARGQKQLDARTDLYAVGVVLFQCVVGRVPFEGDNFNELMFRIVLEARPDPLQIRPDLDPALAAIVVKAIACAPEGRYQSAAELDQALMEWLSTRGMASLGAPSFRKMARSSPAFMLTPQPTPQPAIKTDSAPHIQIQSSATLPIDQYIAETGVAPGLRRSSTTGATTSTPQPSAAAQTGASELKRRRPNVALIAGGAVAVLAVLGIGISMSRKPAESTDTAAARANLEATSLPAAASSPAPVAPIVPVETAAAAAPDATPPTAASSVTVAPVAPATPAAHGKAHVTSAPAASAKVATAPAASASPAAAPAPVAPPAAASTSAIDGRSIRTGL